MTAPAIHLSGSLRAGNTGLMDAFDLTLPAGQWSVVLGPSGIGKTSLLRLIAGLPCAARLDGRVAALDGATLAPRVAMMGQDDQLLPWASALDNVTIGARLRGEQPQRNLAHRLLADVGLADHTTHKPAQLSAGQRQRVALARTLFEDRAVVLLDEPFSALDALTRDMMQGMAARLLHGRTVVLITHDPAEAIRLADRAWIATRGGIVPCDLPGDAPPRAPDATATLAAQAALLQRMRQLCAPKVA